MRPTGDDEERFLSAREAARLLDVKLQTLYAYASRGWLRSSPAPGTRRRRYLRGDVERLKARHDARAGHAPAAAAALRFGQPVLDTRLTAITPQGPVLRGHPAVALAARGVPFESVAELLWTGTLPQAPPRWPWPSRPPLPWRAFTTLVPPGAPPLRALALALAALPEPAAPDAPTAAREVLAACLSLLERRRPEAPPPHESRGVAARVLHALGGRWSAGAERAVDAALVLCADHELNASAFAARVAASTGAGLTACLSAALAAFAGVRHGAASLAVEAMLGEVRRPEDAGAWVRARRAAGLALPGFGHPLYTGGDPRVPPLLRAAAALAPRSRPVRVLHAVAAAAAPARELPNLDFGLVAVACAAGLPPGGAQGLFALGRTAGWVAHVLEQRESDFLLRPRARYVGPPPAP
jgi:citrate synthase